MCIDKISNQIYINWLCRLSRDFIFFYGIGTRNITSNTARSFSKLPPPVVVPQVPFEIKIDFIDLKRLKHLM